MKIRLKCTEAHRLAAERLDRSLPLADRLRLRLHLAGCDACTAFARQMTLLRRAVSRLGNGTADGDAEPPAPPA